MRKAVAFSVALGLGAATGSGALAANTASWQFNLRTTVPGTCSIQNGRTVSTSNSTIGGPGTSPTTIDFSPAVNLTTALLNAASAVWAADAMCNNFATRATLASQLGTMVNSQSPQVIGGAFLTKVDYTVDGNWAAIALSPLIANRQPQTPIQSVTQIGGAINGALQLTFAVPASAVPLLAGTYTDVVTLTLFTNP